MSNAFFIVIVVVLSSQNIDVIYNKVTPEQVKNYELGWQSSKRILNSQKEILTVSSEAKKFNGNKEPRECFLNFAGADGGWISQFMNLSKLPSELDVKQYSIQNNLPLGNDEDIIRYCHAKIFHKI
ncbi:MAG: hypothetical protein KDK36_05330 [Leptospiraceae bacterium]|nr:hypothetical protein [Leptospiraceae bacterium]